MITPSYLPYHEPSLAELLVSSTFLLALNGVNSVLDRTLACGLVGQVLIGTAWGESGAGWLSIDSQRVASSLGYLGLILIVYAGGVETNVLALRKNIVLSVAVAFTGVAVPIGLSFALLAIPGPFLGMDSNKTLLPAFAAGAALCSTSLGTTFSVLQASGLSHTRLGAVLASAALLDDVVGLVMVRIISSLGQRGNSGIEPATILRPVLVSVAFAVAVLLACRCVLQPGQKALDSVIQRWNNKEKTSRKARAAFWIRSQEAGFLSQTALLILLVVAADYAGTSVLLAAYLAGVVVSWWDGQRDDPRVYSQPQSIGTQHDETRVSSSQYSQEHARREHVSTGDGASADTLGQGTPTSRRMASRVFEEYYAQSVNRILKPFFFASIGFSIPISQLFVGGIVFRGIIYSVLMIIGKLVCGLWLVRFSISMSDTLRSVASFISSKYRQNVSKIRTWGFKPKAKSTAVHEPQPHESPTAQTTGTELSTQLASRPRSVEPVALCPPTPELATPPKPLSLYPAAVMGCAMVARGEIGFLISSTAESQGIFRRPDEIASKASGLFLIVTWAIFVCTIIGPVCTGLLVRRIQKLERAAEASRSGTRDVLGVWGVG